MYRSILVPLDGSTFAEHALPLALTIARRAGATIQLVHVRDPQVLAHPEAVAYYDQILETRLKIGQRNYLDRVVDRLRTVSSVHVTGTLLEGEIVATLRVTASSSNTDLVIMASHGRGPFERFWLGSVADGLVRELSVPLLLIRPPECAVDFTQEKVLKHFLLPLDGSLFAEQIIKPATALGTLMDSDYTLLRVVQPAFPDYLHLEGYVLGHEALSVRDQIERMQAQLLKDTQEYLDRVADPLRAESLRIQTRVLVNPHPASGILKQTTNGINDMVAIESHCRRGLSRFLIGSVADKVLRGVSVPMLVHHPVYQ